MVSTCGTFYSAGTNGPSPSTADRKFLRPSRTNLLRSGARSLRLAARGEPVGLRAYAIGSANYWRATPLVDAGIGVGFRVRRR